MNQHTFEDVGVAAQIYPAQSSSFVGMCEGALQALTPLAQQPSASRCTNPSSITVDSVARGVLSLPIPAATSRLGYVSANTQDGKILQERITVITFVSNQLLNDLSLRLGLLDVFGRFNQRLLNRFCVALVRWLNGYGYNGAGLQIDSMLGLVRQMRASIFHLCNARIRILGMSPVIIRSLLWSLSVQARQVFTRWSGDPGSFGDPRQECLVALTRVAPHNATQRCIRFQRRGV